MNTQKTTTYTAGCLHLAVTRIVSLILSLTMIFSIKFSHSNKIYANTINDAQGNNINWSFNEDTGELCTSGYGEMIMKPMSDLMWEWLEYKDEILSVVISQGITNIGDCAFFKCTNLKSIEISNSVKK